MRRRQILAAFGIGRTRIFDMLRFVKNQIRKLYAAQKIAAETGSGVRENDQIIIRTFFQAIFTICALGSCQPQSGDKFFSLTFPVGDQ